MNGQEIAKLVKSYGYKASYNCLKCHVSLNNRRVEAWEIQMLDLFPDEAISQHEDIVVIEGIEWGSW